MSINLLKVSKKSQRQYREDVSNNENDDYMTIRKKLTRNFLLGEVYNETDELIWKRWGNLFICVDKKENKVINVFNDRIHRYDYTTNDKVKHYFNIKLGLA